VISLVCTISRKSFKIVATRCHILKLKCTKFDFGWGAGGAYRASPDPLAGFNGPTFKGTKGRRRERRERKEHKGVRKGREVEWEGST